MANTLLTELGQYFDENNIFTFGSLDSDGHITNLPEKKKGQGITITEMSSISQPLVLGNISTSMESRHITLYIYPPSSSITWGEDKAYEIYNFIRSNSNPVGKNFQGLTARTPQYFGELENKRHVYVVILECKYTNT